MLRRPSLTVPLVLSWADAHHCRTGQWPQTTTGWVRDGPLGENWRKIDNTLRYGLRGLDGGASLAQLLERCRGVRKVQDLLPLTEGRGVEWAVRHKLKVQKMAQLRVRSDRGGSRRSVGERGPGPSGRDPWPPRWFVPCPVVSLPARDQESGQHPAADDRPNTRMGGPPPRANRPLAPIPRWPGPRRSRRELAGDRLGLGTGTPRTAGWLRAGPCVGQVPGSSEQGPPPSADEKADQGVGQGPLLADPEMADGQVGADPRDRGDVEGDRDGPGVRVPGPEEGDVGRDTPCRPADLTAPAAFAMGCGTKSRMSSTPFTALGC